MKDRPNLLFLDVDGVLNCQVFYEKRGWPTEEVSHAVANLCPDRIKWINDLCKDTNTKVVVSSTWRLGKHVDELQDMFDGVGGTFEVVGITPSIHAQPPGPNPYNTASIPRGVEIKYWLDHTPFKYSNYAIVDDDGDMLLEQGPHFFQTDPYAGLTPFTCQRIKDFLTP
ncbi:HAD domain-containing protein [Hymenobacter sp. M29]|uniref:HAD domain-containing protein n=1 Tax=Hymenobacter mellowenesis TaxID=3063995 RepID=A0ABT9ACP4_9BACT|nr:HAD domain-containing protein [Hymenobacter sp. M29]MDO7847584.1 HAD domain-containing protein [Hymenobacter sp. M29]